MTNPAQQQPIGRPKTRIAAGLTGAILVVAGATFAAGPPRAELIKHDEALPYRTDRRGRTDVPFEKLLA